MNKIAILYICTDKYNCFLEGFLTSFEKYFCPKSEKIYHVFTDLSLEELQNIVNGVDDGLNKRIVRHDMPHLPWPLPTLLRYWMFSQIEEELKASDYVFLMNANIVCKDYVNEEDYLPRKEIGEKLTFTIHPGFANKSTYYAPFERRRDCRAFIDWGKEQQYVFGAMNGGVTSDYLDMVRTINQWTNDDLKEGIIAKVHDESYVNRYVLDKKDIRCCSGEKFCCPEEYEAANVACIVALDKQRYISVDKVKKIETISTQPTDIGTRIVRFIISKKNYFRWKNNITRQK